AFIFEKITHAQHVISVNLLFYLKMLKDVDVCALKTTDSFEKKHKFSVSIKKILIANNGMAALKFIRSVRQWCYHAYENELMIHFVAMATPEDINGHAEYTQLADEIVTVPSGPSHLNYGNVELISELAQEIPVQAVWAGWGHASENPKLPEILFNNSIIFIGPTPTSMQLLGDKISSTIIAQSLSIPTLTWSGTGVTLYSNSGMHYDVPKALYDKCILKTSKSISKFADSFGFPFMLKASEGGGGKGIRKIFEEIDYDRIFKQISTEVPNSPIFATRMLKTARHIEIQLIGDHFGNVIALFSRDCSIQRRHQKIIEEAPAIICPQHILQAMECGAIKIAKSVGYVGAGTVEYLYDITTKEYFFLELNPRLQVEHPCTEIIANVNLPSCQLQVAIGKSLFEIEDLKNFMESQKNGAKKEEFPKGHVISARITAESAEEGFRPCNGCVKQLNFHSSKNIWGYFSVHAEGKLHKYADSQFGHLFSWGHTREEARKGMVLALKELSIHGEIRTTIDFLVSLMEHPIFLKNQSNTEWLDNIKNDSNFFTKPDIKVIIACAASCIGHQNFIKITKDYEAALEKGHVPKFTHLIKSLNVEFIYQTNKFSLTVSRASANTFFICINQSTFTVNAYALGNNGLLVAIDNRSYSCFLRDETMHYALEIGSTTCLLYKDLDPSVLRSPSAGKLISLLSKDGDHILKGSDYAEIEVMKMVMPLTVTETGCIHYLKSIGSILESGMVIARLELDNPKISGSITPFSLNFESFNSSKPSYNLGSSDYSSQSTLSSTDEIDHHNTATRKKYKSSYQNLIGILDGNCIPEPFFSQCLSQDLLNIATYLAQPSFVPSQLMTTLCRIKNHLPKHIFEAVYNLINHYSVNITSIVYELPIDEIHSIINDHVSILEKEQEQPTFLMNISDLLKITNHLQNGPKAYKVSILAEFLEKYLAVEKHFAYLGFEHSVQQLMSAATSKISENCISITDILYLILSHANIRHKNTLVVKIIDLISECTKYLNNSIESVKILMSNLSNLPGNNHLKVALRAKQFLISSLKPSFELRHNQLESIFLSIIGGSNNRSLQILHSVIHSDGVISDILPNFFYSSNISIQSIAIEIYVRRAYFSYELVRIINQRLQDIPLIKFYYIPKGRLQSKKKSIGYQFQINQPNKGLLSCKKKPVKIGVLIPFASFENLRDCFVSVLSFLKYSPYSTNSNCYNDLFNLYEVDETLRTVNICIQIECSDRSMQEEYANLCQNFVLTHIGDLQFYKIRRITLIITNLRGDIPLFYTFRAKHQFNEDKLFRHIDPAEGFLLEMKKMINFDLECISCENPNIHMYFGKSKSISENCKFIDQRFFIRTIIRNVDLISVEASFEYLVKASEVRLLEALDQLVINTSKLNKTGTCNYIFFNFTPCIVIDPQKTVECIRAIVLRHSRRLFKQKITQAEMKMVVLLEEEAEPIPLRLIASNDSGYHLNIDLYKEVLDPTTGKIIYQDFDFQDTGQHSGLVIDYPYPSLGLVQSKRLYAHSLGTSYVYDYPELFNQALNLEWKISLKDQISDNCVPRSTFQELCLTNNHSFELTPIELEPGHNRVGIICWKANLYSPYYKNGTEIMLVANDITFMNGSFTELEANVFKAAGIMAREKQIPLIYICCCNGAQMGLADEVKNVYKVKWTDEKNYDKGIEYLYLEQDDYDRLITTNSIKAEKIEDNSSVIYKITDIFGKIDGIGVENLRGSGLIAGEMSQCYKEIFTISLVTGRAVGIGAYLVRLGRRVVQVEKSSIILTGANALNNVLGKSVYSSHDQLGGIDIMYSNGVSQIVAKDDLDGIRQILSWLAYHISMVDETQAFLNCVKNVNLEILTDTTNESDPRNIVYGSMDSKGNFLQGFFDSSSIFEINNGWARTVIAGRARLGGIPVAYIMNDTKTIKSVIPVDPADPDDIHKDCIGIGQVLSPDSSFKFAQTIEDSNAEKLPLFIFANFRGFSAGMKDMYNQVLKFGAMIVDSLRAYDYPVFVYIMPNGELRGGSWAVLDPSINPKYMEIYSCDTSSANILEPSALVSIKYRESDIIKTICRLNKNSDEHDFNASNKHKTEFSEQEFSRNEKDLIKSYKSVAEYFAKLHDTPCRMLDKKVIKKIVCWKDSRRFFYWRLKRRIHEKKIWTDILSVNPSLNDESISSILHSWFEEKNIHKKYQFQSDEQFVQWLEENLIANRDCFYKENLKWIGRQSAISSVKNILNSDP
ncbi:hypothetical protein HZS_7231, partial [Henneguya salminicola]